MAALFSYQSHQVLYSSSPKRWLGLPEPYGQWSPRFKTCSVSEFQLLFLRGWCWENSGQLMLAMGCSSSGASAIAVPAVVTAVLSSGCFREGRLGGP